MGRRRFFHGLHFYPKKQLYPILRIYDPQKLAPLLTLSHIISIPKFSSPYTFGSLSVHFFIIIIIIIIVGLPDLPYFPGAPVFRPLSPVSRTEAKISRI